MTENSSEFGGRFVRNYSQLLTKVWKDDKEMSALLANPTQYAINAGLPVANGNRVEVDRSAHEGLPTKTEIVEAWTARTGVHVLRVPQDAPVDLAELTDAELDTVAAGDTVIVLVL